MISKLEYGKNYTKIIFLLIFVFYILVIRVDASIPVTYNCCYDYSNTDGIQLDNFDGYISIGTQIDNFENLSNWIVGGIGATQQADKTNFKEGIQGLKLIAVSGNRAYTDKVLNNNFSNTSSFVLWLYVPDVSTFSATVIYFTSTGSAWSKYFLIQPYGFTTGWNKLMLNKGDFQNVGGENWNNVMNRIRITVYPNGSSTNATLDDLRYVAATNWTISGNGGYAESDNINFKEGVQGLKLVTTNGGYMRADKAINKNFSNTNNFAVWVYISNADNLNFIRLFLTSTGSFVDTYFYDNVYGVKTGWNKLVFNKHNFENIGGEDWNNVMNMIRLEVGALPGTSVNYTFDDLRYDMKGQRAKLMIEFDDGDLNTFTNAYPIMGQNNQTGVTYVVTSWVGADTTHMDLSNLRSLQSAGWDISSHTVDHEDLRSLNSTGLAFELNGSYDWLVNNKFRKSAGFIAYPYGYFNDNTIESVKKRYIFGRSTKPESAEQHLSFADDAARYIQRVIGVYNGSSVQSIKDDINDTINAKLFGIIYFHQIVDSNPSSEYEYLKTDFQSISNYIKSRNADIDVVTYSDIVIPNINNFTPIINKTTRIFYNGTSVMITKNKYDEYMPNMTVMPSAGSIDIGITDYNETNGYVAFNESGSSSNVNYNIGDRIPIRVYNIKIYLVNGTLYQNFNIMANNAGNISYNSPGFGGSRYQKISFVGAVDTTFTVSLPIGYTFLRFNASNSTVTNLGPDGQNNSRPIFNITNNGNIDQSFALNISGTVKNITTYGDLSNNFSRGRIEINASSAMVIPNLIPGKSQNLWMIIDANNAPVMNKNLTLMINSRNSS